MSRISLLFMVVLMMSCKTITAPKKSVPNRKGIHTDAFGGWLTVTTSSGKIAGELIAATSDSLYIMTRIPEGRRTTPKLTDPTKVVAAAKTDISTARLVIFNTNSSNYDTWTAIGVVSTLSHGAVLLISAPLWLGVGTITSGIEASRPNYLDYPAKSWKEIETYSRFPQGIPEGINVRALKGR